MECQLLRRTNYSLPKILLLVWFCQASLRHLSASERLSYLHWLPVHYRIQSKIATLTYTTLAICQPSYLYDLLEVHQPSRALRTVLQPSNFSMYHICLLILVGVLSATALLQHGIPSPPPLKLFVPNIQCQAPLKSLTS